jgi:hypothetical protein
MGRPEIMRSGEVSLGDNPAGNEVDEKENQPTDTIGPVPDENKEGHRGNDDHEDPDKSEDPDKPVKKFAERFPAGDETSTSDPERGDETSPR